VLTFLHLSDDLGLVSGTFPRKFVSYSATLTLHLFTDCYTEHVQPFSHLSCPATVTLQMLIYCYIASLHRLLHWRRSVILTLRLFSHCDISAVQPRLHCRCCATAILQLFTHCHISAIQTLFNIPALYPPLQCSCTVQPLSQDPACSLLSRCHSAAGPAYYCVQQYTHNRLPRTVGRGHCFQALLST